MSEQSHDRFTLPGDIPDYAYWRPSDRDAGPARERQRQARAADAAHERKRSHPAGRGWVPLSRDLGIPGEHDSDDPAAALGCSAVFTRELRVRFLDHLAFKGNVRAAAARVGVSHETAYRKRRQDAAFAALWDAALVHARHYGESQLATRALDGVEVPVWHRGEIVGYQVKHDSRLLLAHLARLDKRVENDAAARACAGRFDELLAGYAGHEALEGFAGAAEEARDWRQRGTIPDLPPTRAEYVAYYRGLALDAVAAGVEDDEEARIEAETEAMDDVGEEAGAEWDAWHAGALARVVAIVEDQAEREGEDDEQLAAPLPQAGGAGGGSETPHRPTPDPSRRREGEPDAASDPAPSAWEVPAPSDPDPSTGEASAPSDPAPSAWEVPAPSDPPPFTGEVPKAEGAPVRSHATNEGEGGPAESDEDDGAIPPYEIKSARAISGRFPPRENPVTGVNPRDNCAVAHGCNRPILPPSR